MDFPKNPTKFKFRFIHAVFSKRKLQKSIKGREAVVDALKYVKSPIFIILTIQMCFIFCQASMLVSMPQEKYCFII